MNKFLKVITTVVFTLLVFLNVEFITVGAEENSGVENFSIEDAINRCGGKEVNILDLIDAKVKKDSTSKEVITDYMFGKDIASEVVDVDDIRMKEPLKFYSDIKRGDEHILNYMTYNNHNVVNMYSPSKLTLKKLKLDRVFTVEDSVKNLYEVDLIKRTESLVGTIQIDKDGYLGWSSDSFEKNTNVNIDLDTLESCKENYIYISSLVSKGSNNSYDHFIELTDSGLIFEVFNKDRTIIIKTVNYEDTAYEDNWFYKFSSRSFEEEKSIVFGRKEDYKIGCVCKIIKK